jgi:hypothetical protein
MGGERDALVETAVLRFTVRRGEVVGVTKEDYLRELSRELKGVSYSELDKALVSLKRGALVEIDEVGLKDFMVRPTIEGIEELQKRLGK